MYNKSNAFSLLFIAFLAIAAFSSCKKENMEELTNTQARNTTQGNINSSNDTNNTQHSNGDEEEASMEDCEEFCFDFVYPITIVFPDGSTQAASDDESLFTLIETWYDQNEDSEEDPTLSFPVDVILESDSTTASIADEEALEMLIESCFEYEEGDEGEEEWEDDCFAFVYPLVIVLPDGSQVTANDDEELEEAVENWYDANPDSEDDPSLVYPVNVELEDSSTVAIQNDEELEELIDACYGEDFEECFEINYPVSISLPGQGNVTLDNEEALYDAVDAWYEANPDSEEDPDFVYPITVNLYDGGTETINNADELDDLFEDCYEEDCEFDGEDLSMGVNSAATTKAVFKKHGK